MFNVPDFLASDFLGRQRSRFSALRTFVDVFRLGLSSLGSYHGLSFLLSGSGGSLLHRRDRSRALDVVDGSGILVCGTSDMRPCMTSFS